MILLVLALKMPSVPTPFLLLLHGILFGDQDDVQDMVDDVPVAPNIWTDGSREPIPSLTVIVGVMLKILMIRMRVALTSSRGSLAQFSRSRGLSIGRLILLCKSIPVFILVLTI